MASREGMLTGLADDRFVVIENGGRRIMGGEMRKAISCLSSEITRLGLPDSQRIAVLLPNSIASAIAILAIGESGHCCLPLNTGLKAVELARTLERCDVGTVVCAGDPVSGLPKHVATIDASRFMAPGLELTTPGPALDPLRSYVCLSTSGSTGEPKFAERSARAVLANSRRVAAELKTGPEDRFLSVVPFWHANGFSNCLVMPLLAGASIVTMERFLPRQFIEAIVENQVTVVVGSPFIYRSLLRVLDSGLDLSRVRAWISSGAMLSEGLDDELRSAGIRVRQLYGSSETGTLCLSEEARRPPGMVGKPLPGVQIKLLRADGSPCAEGEAGEVRVYSDALFSGYVAAKRPVFAADGGYDMNDRAVFEAGDLRLLGRADAMINVAGVKVDPEEVRAVIEKMAGVRRARVAGVEDAAGGESVKAWVVADTELLRGDVMAHCRQRLAEYKLPRIIEFCDHIPEDLMGKSARRLLGD